MTRAKNPNNWNYCRTNDHPLIGGKMKPEVYIEDISTHLGKEVTLYGWLYNKRSSGKLRFLQLRDGTGIIQCVVFKKEVSPEIFTLTDELNQESSLAVTGVIREDKRSPLGFELGVTNIEMLSNCIDYPIQPKEHTVSFLMNNRHLWLRSSRQFAIMKIRDEVISAINDFFHQRKFILMDTPIITPNACEGTTSLFKLGYFGQDAFLAQSGQLYNEANAMAFSKVYCFGPTFRAEKSKTRRHLTEFWMVEPEMAFYDLDGVMDLAEDLVLYLVERVLERQKKNLDLLERDISKLEQVKRPLHRITYQQAVEKLEQVGHAFKYGEDFGGEDETVLTQQYDRPILVHRWPRQCKAFYMKKDPQNSDLAMGVDVLAPEGYGEIIGGGQREDDYQTLLESLKKHDLSEEDFFWYLDLRKYGSVPHGGFGLGLERTVAWLCGTHHVRETIPFPRMLERIIP